MIWEWPLQHIGHVVSGAKLVLEVMSRFEPHVFKILQLHDYILFPSTEGSRGVHLAEMRGHLR